MKKILTLIAAVVLISSCEINSDPIELTASTTIHEPISVNIAQTSGAAAAYDETVAVDLNQIVSNFSQINSVNVDALSYRFQNVTGNTNAVIQSATLVINGITVTSIANVNIAQEANNGSVFTITDQNVLDQLEALFLSTASISIQFTGTVLSDEGSVNFDVRVSVGITVST